MSGSVVRRRLQASLPNNRSASFNLLEAPLKDVKSVGGSQRKSLFRMINSSTEAVSDSTPTTTFSNSDYSEMYDNEVCSICVCVLLAPAHACA